MGGIYLQKWGNAIIALQGLDDATARCYLMKRDSNSWSEAPFAGVPKGYYWAIPTIDQDSGNVFFEQGYMEDDRLVMKVLIGSLKVTRNIMVQEVKEKEWITDKKSIFGDTSKSVRLNDPGKRDWPNLNSGIIKGSDMYIPYRIAGITVTTYSEHGPFNNGVFHSSDAGITWMMERISTIQAFHPAMCGSKGYYYYFAESLSPKRGEGFALWFSRKQISGGSWSAPETVTKTVAYGAKKHYAVASANDVVHLCWLDRRHNKWRFNWGGPNIENDDIVYSHRKDSDSSWGKDVILSKGILYCYAPSMSVDGNSVVVAWSGIQTADRRHTDYDPNDIFYVTSKDGGNTWSKPLKVTNGVKDGITSGEPQVMLLNGVIHLFYIQGKRETQQLSPGLTKLNQPPWPIYYTQRPFPE